MILRKRMPVLEVAEILRKYQNHKLNRKIYRDFNEDDFDGVHFLKENGFPRCGDLIKEKEVKVFRLESSDGEVLEFNSVSEIAEFFEFKSLSHWRKYVEQEKYKVI